MKLIYLKKKQILISIIGNIFPRMKVNAFLKITIFLFSLGAYSACSENKLPSKFQYYNASRDDVKRFLVGQNIRKAHQLQVKRLESDSVEISFVLWHSTDCPLDGLITQIEDTIYMNIGAKCPPDTEASTPSAEILRFVWRLKLKDPAKYTFIPRKAASGQTWHIPVKE
ncbi:hypothetical protein [Nibribacter koreensis]|uniref:Uncharacterized protein n=1 Tax=Nibribacter koreensis TaxID=1084519 RepID=A0ABP8FME9_9BACT